MGLFDKAKGAFGAAAGNTPDLAEQARLAQELANQSLRDAGYTDGSPVTMANASEVRASMTADHDVLNAYGQELNRIIAIGEPGSSIIRSSVDSGERTAGNPWFHLEIEVTLPGREPYTVQKREMVPPQVLASYAAGTVHDIKVDPADPTKTAFTS
ncbi:hypothetical protein [Luethyella okanaganae]|uniref:Peptidoglycan-binding protein LysM n=1 Tax=Luethyella okanaganae TaxID=69372 RepID=A0ABW1VCM4_9MICO